MVGCPRFLKKAAVLFGIMGFTAQGLFKTGTALAETSEASSSVSSEAPSQPRWACCITNRNNEDGKGAVSLGLRVFLGTKDVMTSSLEALFKLRSHGQCIMCSFSAWHHVRIAPTWISHP